MIITHFKHFGEGTVCLTILFGKEPLKIFLEKMLGQHMCVTLEIMVLILIKFIRKSTATYYPYCESVFYIRVIELEFVAGVL